MTKWEKGPPGWILATLVSVNVLAVVWLAGLGVGSFLELLSIAGADLLKWSATVVGLWLTYKFAKGRRFWRQEDDYDDEPTGGPYIGGA